MPPCVSGAKCPGSVWGRPRVPATLCGVFVETDDTTGLARRVEPVRVGGRLSQAMPESLIDGHRLSRHGAVRPRHPVPSQSREQAPTVGRAAMTLPSPQSPGITPGHALGLETHG